MDNTSTYYINNKKCSFKDVQNLLMSHGVDLEHNRFLILQGEVEHIALMKPKAHNNDEGLLEFLEDIIGSSRFKEPIEVVAKRVEGLNEMRGEKLNRVKIVENEKNKLEGVKDEAIRFLTAENDIALEQNKVFQINAFGCRSNTAQSEEKLKELDEEAGGVNQQMTELQAEKTEVEKGCKKLKKELAKLVEKREQKRIEFTEIDQKFVKLGQDLKHSRTKLKKLKKDFETESQKLEDLRNKPQQLAEENEILVESLGGLEADKARLSTELQQVLESLRPLTQDLQKEKDTFEEELVGLCQASDEAKQKLDITKKELELLLKRQQAGATKLEQATADRAENQNNLEERKKILADLKKKLPKGEQNLDRARQDLHTANTDEHRLVGEIRDGRVKVEEMRSSAQSQRSQGEVLQALMEEKRQGRIPGIYGRMGDLGAIDARYDVAVSTAVGQLDYIVCDSIETGSQAVNFLKQRNIGRRTFLSLDKQQHFWQNIRRRDPTPENVPRLFDLIKVDNEDLLPAFYFGCRETLVAKDMGQANRIAFGNKRYRVVTLDGKLIEMSGTMAGGGRPARGRMGSKLVQNIDPSILEKEQEGIQNCEAQLANLRRNKDLLQDTIRKCEREVEEDRFMMEKCGQDIQGFTRKEQALKTRIAELEAELRAACPDESVVDELKGEIANQQTDFDKARKASEAVQTKVKALDDRISAITEDKTRPVQDQFDRASNELDAAQGKLTKNKAAIKTAERNLKKTTDKVATLQKEGEECEEACNDHKQGLDEMSELAERVNVETNEMDAKKTASEEELELKITELKRVESTENDIRKEVLEFEHKRNKLQETVDNNKQKERHWNKEIQKLEMHKIDGVETPVLEKLDDEELAACTDDMLQQFKFQVTVLEEQLSKMTPNMAAIAEYRKKEALYLQRVGELEHVTRVRDEQRELNDSYRKQRHDEFRSGFEIITNKLKEMYRMITLGTDI